VVVLLAQLQAGFLCRLEGVDLFDEVVDGEHGLWGGALTLGLWLGAVGVSPGAQVSSWGVVFVVFVVFCRFLVDGVVLVLFYLLAFGSPHLLLLLPLLLLLSLSLLVLLLLYHGLISAKFFLLLGGRDAILSLGLSLVLGDCFLVDAGE
jgi:hypothetical protein